MMLNKLIAALKSVWFLTTLLIVLSLISGFLLLFGNFQNTNTVTVQDISLHELTEKPRNFPIEIYVANEFNQKQKENIKKSLKKWNEFSNGKVTYKITFDWKPKRSFDIEYYTTSYPKITVWRKKWNDPAIFRLQLQYSLVADGFSIKNMIVIVDHDDLDDNKFYTIFTHEFGHTLGLEHIKLEYPALMNVNGNKGRFSKYDKIMFQKLY